MNSSNSNSANTDIEFTLNSNNIQQQVKQARTTINSASSTNTSADICDDDLSLYGMYVNEPSSHQQQSHHSNHQQQQNQQATITVIRGGGSSSNNNQSNKMQYLVRNESAIIMANSANNQYQQHQQQHQHPHQHQQQQQLDQQNKQQQQQRSQLQNILQYNKVYKSTIIVPNSTSSATLTRISSANKIDCNVDSRCNQEQLSDDEHEVDLSDGLSLNGKPSSPIHHQQQVHNRRARRLQTRSPTLTSVYIEDFNCRSNRMPPITVIQAGIARGESTNNKNKHYHNSMNELDNGEASNEYITADEHHYQYQPTQSDATLSEHTNSNNNRHRSQQISQQHHHRQVVTIIDEDNIVDDDVDDNDYTSSGNLSNFILKNSANEILIGCNNNVIDDDDDDIAGGRRTAPGHHTNEIDIGDIDDDDVVHHHHHHHHHHDDLLVKDHSSNHLVGHNDCVEYLNDDLEDLKVMIVC